jgi:hypothetical protein
VLGTVAVIALIVGGIVGVVALRPSAPKSTVAGTANPAGSPAAEVALPSENNPGPVRMDGLTPSGFTTGRTGAIAAAAAYSKAAVQLSTRTDADVRTALRKVVTNPTNIDTAFVAPVASLRTTLNARTDSTLRVVPLGSRVATTNTNANVQNVDVWLAVLSATPSGFDTPTGVIPAPTEVAYVTASTTVVRTGGDWKLESLRITEGPTPALGTNAPLEADAFAKELRGYAPYSYLPPVEAAK